MKVPIANTPVTADDAVRQIRHSEKIKYRIKKNGGITGKYGAQRVRAVSNATRPFYAKWDYRVPKHISDVIFYIILLLFVWHVPYFRSSFSAENQQFLLQHYPFANIYAIDEIHCIVATVTIFRLQHRWVAWFVFRKRRISSVLNFHFVATAHAVHWLRKIVTFDDWPLNCNATIWVEHFRWKIYKAKITSFMLIRCKMDVFLTASML